MIAIHRSFARHGLVRDTQDNLLGGVCSGLARRFGVDAWAVRILVVASLLVIPGSQIIIYPILWVLMPDEARAQAALQGASNLPAASANPTFASVAPASGAGANQGSQPLSTQAASGDPLVKSAQ